MLPFADIPIKTTFFGHSMTVDLLDPASMGDRYWPADSEALRTFVEAICRHGSETFVTNVRTRMMVLRDADVVLPVTISEAQYDNSYICSTYSYLQYMKHELNLIGNEFVEWIAAKGLDGTASIVRMARIDKVVQVNDWLFDVNPYPVAWTPDIASITDVLTAAFPDHFIAFGSLNKWANSSLIEKLADAGYSLGAFRQVYVYDRLSETYFSHEHVQRDRRLLRLTPYRLIHNDDFGEADYPRMAELYGMLYLQKHSKYNPAYTSDHMRVCHRSGVVDFVGFRNPEGRLDGITGLQIMGRVAPLSAFVGYNTTVDRKFGLYRIVMAQIFETASAQGWNVNLSGANAEFKRNRGGQPVIEYKAVYARHLSRARRLASGALAASANMIGAPAMKLLKV